MCASRPKLRTFHNLIAARRALPCGIRLRLVHPSVARIWTLDISWQLRRMGGACFSLPGKRSSPAARIAHFTSPAEIGHAYPLSRRYTSRLPKLSYSCGAAAPLMEKTISQTVLDTAASFPDREALVVCHQNIRFTWSELDLEVTGVARGLAGLGLRPGDRAGIWASNCLEWILLQHAAGRAGVVLVNVNPAYRSHELRYVLQKSRIRALFLRERETRANYRAILDDSVDGEALPLEHVVWLGEPSWDAMIAGGRDFPRDTATTHDVANIQYTSGTTGSPKGVLLTHHNLLNNGKAISLAMRATEQDRICAPVPLYHCFGSVIASMVSVV